MTAELILLKDIPNLDTYEVASADLAYEYWTPEEGDKRRLIFFGISERMCADHTDPDKQVALNCAVFIERDKDGTVKTIVNGSKVLVGVFENTQLESGTPVEVTYKGKKKNKTNANMADQWSVALLKEGGK